MSARERKLSGVALASDICLVRLYIKNYIIRQEKVSKSERERERERKPRHQEFALLLSAE